MPLELRENRMDWERVEGQLWGSIARTDPMYRPAISAIRRCRTMGGALGASRRLRRFFLFLADRNVAPVDATRDDIEDYIASFGPDHPANAGSHLAHVKVMYEEAVHRGVIAMSPATRLGVGSYSSAQAPALTLEQARQLLEGVHAALDEPGKRLVAARDLALLTLLVSVGPRNSELRAISWADLQLDSDPPSLMLFGKGRQHRTIRLPGIAVRALGQYRMVLEESGIAVGPEDAVSIGLSARNMPALRDPLARPLAPMSKEALGMLVHGHLESIGLSGPLLGPHRLRATAATLAHLADANVVDIAAMLGHRRIDTTVRNYIRPADALASSPADRVKLLDIQVAGRE
jgi:site-specific recombinase XerD